LDKSKGKGIREEDAKNEQEPSQQVLIFLEQLSFDVIPSSSSAHSCVF
jgi:hypothetical protein